MIGKCRLLCAVSVTVLLICACGSGSDVAGTTEVSTTARPTTEPIQSTTTSESPTTTSVEPEARPLGRGYHEMAYDSESDVVLMIGGSTGPSPQSSMRDAWLLDPNTGTWTEIESPGVIERSAIEGIYSPSPMAYDSKSDRIIYLQTAADLQEDRVGTWAYDANTNTWADLSPEPQPRLGFGARMAYDAESDRVIAFGGLGFLDGGLRWTTETWAFSSEDSRWEELTIETGPPAMNYFSMAYDQGSDRIVVFGRGYETEQIELWAFDYNVSAWEELSLDDSVTYAADYSRAAYDPAHDRVIIFGGMDDVARPSEATWLYDYETNEMAPAAANQLSGPIARHDMVYVGSLGRVLVFGGGPSDRDYSDGLWTYDPATDTWSEFGS